MCGIPTIDISFPKFSARDAGMTRENVPEIVDREIANMRDPYRGRSLCSAISKAFWMMKRHPVVIFDVVPEPRHGCAVLLPRRSRLVGRVEVKGQQGSPLRPVLRTVENTRNLNRVLLDLIDNYVRQRCECEFAPSGHAAAGWSKMGKITQGGRTRHRSFEQRGGQPLGCRVRSIRKCALNPRLRGGTSGPPSGPQEPLKALAHLLVREVLAAL
jgi:hypothetical protein